MDQSIFGLLKSLFSLHDLVAKIFSKLIIVLGKFLESSPLILFKLEPLVQFVKLKSTRIKVLSLLLVLELQLMDNPILLFQVLGEHCNLSLILLMPFVTGRDLLLVDVNVPQQNLREL